MAAKKKGKRAESDPGTLDEDALRRAALRYLERFDSTASNLRRVLAQKVRRSAARGVDVDLDEATHWIDAIVARFESSGIVDDRRFAEAYARGQRERGASRRAISTKLGAKGVDSATANAVLDALQKELGADAELAAARRFVKRKRLGPHRSKAGDAHRDRRRDLAALARAGYSFEVAKRALGCEAELDDPEGEL